MTKKECAREKCSWWNKLHEKCECQQVSGRSCIRDGNLTDHFIQLQDGPVVKKEARTKGDLRVWWIPQVPGKAFYVPVNSPQMAKKILDVLANYDLFQLKNNIKPDYSNVGGLHEFDGMEWGDWCDEDGNDIDTTETV